jgi:hypothetical protein
MRSIVLRASLAAVLTAGCASGTRLRLEREEEAPIVVQGGDFTPLQLSERELVEGMDRFVAELRAARRLRLDISEPELREALEDLARGMQTRRHGPPGPEERLAAEWLALQARPAGPDGYVLPAGLSYAGDDRDPLTARYQAWCRGRGETADCENLLGEGKEWDTRQRERLAMAVAMTHFYDGAAAYAREAVDPTRVRTALAAIIVWYLGMLVIPEPISKVIAVSLTVAMISYVGVETFLGIVEGYRRLRKEVAATWSFEAIAGAGERFGLLVGGSVGRALIMLTTWAMARTVSGTAKIPDPPRFKAAAAAAAGKYGLSLQAAVAGGARTVMVTGPVLTITVAPGTLAMANTATAASKGQADDLLKLNKQLASESQAEELLRGQGQPIAGAGTTVPLRDAPRLAKQHGGEASDWAKVRSSNFKASDGTSFETHAYQNVKTGAVVEIKTKFQ